MGGTDSKTSSSQAEEDQITSNSVQLADIVIIYLTLIRNVPSDFDLHLFLIIQSYAGLSFTISSVNNHLHRGGQDENTLYHQLKRCVPFKRNVVPTSIAITTTSHDQGWCDNGHDGSRMGSHTYFQLQINHKNSTDNTLLKAYNRVMVHRNIRASREFDTETKVYKELRMDVKHHPWYVVKQNEMKEFIVEKVNSDNNNTSSNDNQLASLYYNPQTLICINPSETARTYSTVFDNDQIGRGHARSMLESHQAWSAQHNDKEQWMVIDLGMEANVQGVVISGRGKSCKNQSVTEIAVELSCDKTSWVEVGEYQCETFNENELKFVSLDFNDMKSSSNMDYRYVKIRPLQWKQHISMRAGVVINNVTSPILNLMLKQNKATVNLRKERECPVYMLKSVILAGEKRGEDDEEFEVQLYSRSHYPGWRNNVQNATIEIEFEPDMYKMIEHPLGTAHNKTY